MNKLDSISPKYVFSILAALSYIVLCFVINVNNSTSFYKTTAKGQGYSSEQREPTLEIKQDYFPEKDIISTQTQVVVLDTLVYKVDMDSAEPFMIARVISNNENWYLAKLSFDPNKISEYEALLFKRVKLSAEINRIVTLPYEKSIYTIDNSLVWRQVKSDYLLEGQLIEIISSEQIDS